MDNESEPFFRVTSDDHAGWIVIVTISFVTYALLGVSAKLMYRSQVTTMKSYDWAVIIAIVLALAQSILMVDTCRLGFGQHYAALPAPRFDTLSKELWAASLLSILVHTAAKISVILFVLAIIAGRNLKMVCHAVLGVTATWAVSAVLVIAFRCSLPTPWRGDASSCLDLCKTYLVANIVNIATDLTLIALPTAMMWNVQTTPRVKIQIISLFASRILVPVMLIPQTVYWASHTGLEDQTWALVEPAIWGQIAMNFSILTACVPSLKGVGEMFGSGASTFLVPGHYSSLGRPTAPSDICSPVLSRNRTDIPSSHNRVDDSNLRYGEQKPNMYFRANIQGGGSDTVRDRSESQSRLTGNNVLRKVEDEVSLEPPDLHQIFTRSTINMFR